MSRGDKASVVVMGGGIAGLAAARELTVAGVGNVVVLEASPRWGGKLAGVEIDGVRLDSGAESVLARRPEAVRLIDALGLGHRLVHPTPARSQVLVGGKVLGLPPSAMGVPRDLEVLEGFLSDEGLLRARQEPGLPAPALARDVGIGAYVDQRFGAEVTDRLLEPLLGGVYAGQARQLSFDAVAPALFQLARQGGSLLGHAGRLTATTAHGPVFAGLTGGLCTLVDALVDDLRRRGVTLRTGVTVRELTRRPGGGYRLLTGPVPAPRWVEADGVILSAPAGPTGRLLSSMLDAREGDAREGDAKDVAAADVAAEVASIPYASTASVTLVLRDARLEGSGLLVPPGELPTIKALTYSSNKWEWVARAAARTWGPGASVVRASVGRLGEERLLHMDDAALLARTWAEARQLPGWSDAQLVTGRVTRWGGALPQYLVGHRDLVARLRDGVEARPGLAVCGAALDGVGVAACLASASLAASQVVRDLALAARPEPPASGTTINRQLVERK